jgi:energy-coupling factor transporter ATP-binding protein EcfA2
MGGAKLYLSDLGPIKEGEIELGDITIFVGGPGSGKSTALKALFYSLHCPKNIISLKGQQLKFKDGVLVQKFVLDWRKTKENYEDYVKKVLPGTGFGLKPVNVIDFITSRKLSYMENDIPAGLYPVSLPKPCKDREKVTPLLKGLKYGLTLNGYRGTAEAKVDVNDMKCLKDKDVLSVISTAFIKGIERHVGEVYCREFGKSVLRELGVEDVTYVPGNRSSLVLQKLLSENIEKGSGIEPVLDPVFELAGLDHVKKYYNGLGKLNSKVYGLFKPVLKGELKYVGDELVYTEDDNVIPWSQAPDTVLEVLSLTLPVRKKSLLLIEEPGAGLHEKEQLLIGTALYALSSTRPVVITTNTQSIFYTITHLSYLKPKESELRELFIDLGLKEYNELVGGIVNANREDVKVRVYYFNNGKVEEIDIEEAIKGMPGTIDFLEKEFKWFSDLHSKRLFGTE